MPTFLPRGQTMIAMPLAIAGTRVLSGMNDGGFDAADMDAAPGSGEPDAPDPDTAAQADPIATIASQTANPVGSIGDQALLGNIARAAFHLSGAGITIGILSDSFNIRAGLAADIASGALPSDVAILSEGPAGGTDEGRAMAQLIHKIAPDADLKFYSAFHGEADFANGIRILAAAGANIIVDDVTYLDEPFFQQGGAISFAVSDVVAAGVSYFTSASNVGSKFYENLFHGVSAPLPGLSGHYQTMDFGTAGHPQTTQSLTIPQGAVATIDLQWDQPFASIGAGHASANSLGLVLYDDRDKIVASAVFDRTNGDPVQILRFSNTTGGTSFHLGIVANGGTAPPRMFKYIVYGADVTIHDPNAGIGSGTVIGHALNDDAICVGAIAAGNAPSLGGAGTPEPFSAFGPGVLMFEASGDRIPVPITGQKVDFLAPDGVPTSVFSPFFGTSAAAPQAAAVAALMLQAIPDLNPDEVMISMEESAIALPGPAAQTGFGLMQAPTAVQNALLIRSPAEIAAAKAFGLATPDPDAPGWIVVASNQPAPPPVQAALAAITYDPTAIGSFIVSIDGTAADPSTAFPLGTTFATTSTPFSDVFALLPDWPANGMG